MKALLSTFDTVLGFVYARGCTSGHKNTLLRAIILQLSEVRENRHK